MKQLRLERDGQNWPPTGRLLYSILTIDYKSLSQVGSWVYFAKTLYT